MVIPNLFGILTLHREMKSTIKEYWQGFREEYPDEKTPKN
jgi:AGCS family alanine or glycine:cation symporter